MSQKPAQTTAAGIPVGDNQNSLAAGLSGPGLLSACHLFIVPTMKPGLHQGNYRPHSRTNPN